MSSRPHLRSVPAVAILIVAVSSSGTASAAVSPDEVLREYLAGLQHLPVDELPLTELEMEPRARVRWWITREEAIEDTERFFYLLSHGWCGYGYFRKVGERVAPGLDPFERAEQAVLSRLEAKRRWSPGALSKLIHDQLLTFVTDCHLNLNGEPFCRHLDFWFDSRLELREEDGAFRFTLDGQRHTLVAVDGVSPEPYLFPSVNSTGEAIRLLGLLSPVEPDPLLLTVQTDEGGQQLRRPLTRDEFRPRERFAEERIGGIPVVRIRSFADYHGRELQEIVDRAESYRGEPYVILDIRGNGGGSTRWPKQWISGFTGATPSLKQALTELVSRTSMAGRANIYELSVASYRKQERSTAQADLERYRYEAAHFDSSGVTPYWSSISIPAIEPIPNETTLIVIQDGRVASAGEGAVSYLIDQVENVVFVGENTQGALTFGQQSAHRLPHSKMLVYLPIKLNVPLDMEIREQRGFAPDFWVPASQALNYAVAAARAGTIPTSVPVPAGQFEAEFVPERPAAWWYPQRRDLGLGAFYLILGGLIGVVNRKKGRVVFFVAGVVALALGAGWVFFGSRVGLAFGVVGCAYFAIALVKRSKNS